MAKKKRISRKEAEKKIREQKETALARRLLDKAQKEGDKKMRNYPT